MPIVGFEDEVRQEQPMATEEIIEKREKEIKEFQSTVEKEEIKLSQRKIESLKQIYSEVVVHDYGDGYHKSAEELQDENAFYLLYRKIQGKKTKYRKIDEFIDATRNCLEFLYAVADRQQMYTREEFITRWAKGKITIAGMYLPKYVGKDRKRISKKTLSEFILDGEDSTKFIEELEAPVIDSVEMLNEQRAQLFSKEDYQKIFSHNNDYYDDKEDDTMIIESDSDTFNGVPIAVDIKRKEYKRLMKDNPGLLTMFKESLRGNRVGQSYQDQMIYDMDEDDMEMIAKYDKMYGVKSASDIPEFKGSIMKDKDFDEYMQALEEWEWNNTRVRENGRWITLEERNELNLKESLERAGFNIRALFGNDTKQEHKVRKMIKQERKKEEQLRKDLAQIKKRRKAVDKGQKTEVEVYREALEKKKKKKRKEKAKKHKKDPRLEKGVARKKKQIDEILLGTVDSTKSFKEYEKENLDWSWDNIKKG